MMLMEYETDRLVLKILKPEYAPQLLDFYLRDRELFEAYEPDRSANFYTVPHLKNLMKNEYNLAFKQLSIRFYVFRKEQPNQIIGTVCFYDVEGGSYSCCSMGYKFSSAFHHQGYAAESMRRLIPAVFAGLGVHRITAWVMQDNAPSIRLLKRLGFRREGVCRDYLRIQGKWRDHLQFSLLASDYISSKQNQ